MAKKDAVENALPEPVKKKAGKRKKTFKKRGEKRVVHHGHAHIQASFNNTIITITDAEGNVVAWSSAGSASALVDGKDKKQRKEEKRTCSRAPPKKRKRRAKSLRAG